MSRAFRVRIGLLLTVLVNGCAPEAAKSPAAPVAAAVALADLKRVERGSATFQDLTTQFLGPQPIKTSCSKVGVYPGLNGDPENAYLVIPDESSQTIRILRSSGGAFAAWTTLALPADSVSAKTLLRCTVLVQDLNSDGLMDIAAMGVHFLGAEVFSDSPKEPALVMYFNHGDGTFQATTVTHPDFAPYGPGLRLYAFSIAPVYRSDGGIDLLAIWNNDAAAYDGTPAFHALGNVVDAGKVQAEGNLPAFLFSVHGTQVEPAGVVEQLRGHAYEVGSFREDGGETFISAIDVHPQGFMTFDGKTFQQPAQGAAFYKNSLSGMGLALLSTNGRIHDALIPAIGGIMHFARKVSGDWEIPVHSPFNSRRVHADWPWEPTVVNLHGFRTVLLGNSAAENHELTTQSMLDSWYAAGVSPDPAKSEGRSVVRVFIEKGGELWETLLKAHQIKPTNVWGFFGIGRCDIDSDGEAELIFMPVSGYHQATNLLECQVRIGHVRLHDAKGVEFPHARGVTVRFRDPQDGSWASGTCVNVPVEDRLVSTQGLQMSPPKELSLGCNSSNVLRDFKVMAPDGSVVYRAATQALGTVVVLP